MTGSKRLLVLQPRDRVLIQELARLRVGDREDARLVAGFQSRTRANTRLLALVRAGLLVRCPAGTAHGGHKYLYALSREGARLANVAFQPPLWNPHATLAWSGSLEHQLALNRVYLALKFPPVNLHVELRRWTTFSAPISSSIRLQPDAYAEISRDDNVVRAVFVEVDRGTETLQVWRRKVVGYVRLATSGEFTQRFSQPRFRVAVLAPSVRRLGTLRTCIARQTDKLFWLSVLDHSSSEWLWGQRWLRPDGKTAEFIL